MFVGGNSGRETPGYPFRTRKLSLPALMVLHPGGCGRVSYRRHKTYNNYIYTDRPEIGHSAHPGSFPRFTSTDRKSTRLNSSHVSISYAVFCLKKKTHHAKS